MLLKKIMYIFISILVSFILLIFTAVLNKANPKKEEAKKYVVLEMKQVKIKKNVQIENNEKILENKKIDLEIKKPQKEKPKPKLEEKKKIIKEPLKEKKIEIIKEKPSEIKIVEKIEEEKEPIKEEEKVEIIEKVSIGEEMPKDIEEMLYEAPKYSMKDLKKRNKEEKIEVENISSQVEETPDLVEINQDQVEFDFYREPDYPATAKMIGWPRTMRIIIRLLIGIDGRVKEVKAISGDMEIGFDKEAVKAAEKWRFKPIIIKGKRVRAWLEVPVVFPPIE